MSEKQLILDFCNWLSSQEVLYEVRKQLIFDFCKWLGSQGLLYEVIYYGTYEEIKEAIDKYLAEKELEDERL